MEGLQKSVAFKDCTSPANQAHERVQVRYFVGRYEASFSLSMVDLPTGLSTFDLACSPVQTSAHCVYTVMNKQVYAPVCF